MGQTGILPRINIEPFQLQVPLGKCLLYTEMEFKCHSERTRDHTQCSIYKPNHDRNIFRLAGLPRLRGDASLLRPHRGVLRVLCLEKAKYHVWVSHGRKDHGDVPHIHVADCQVPNIFATRLAHLQVTKRMWLTNVIVISSYISGISLLGLPAEMYTYGTQLWMVVLSEWAVSLTIAIVYLPVFYNLQITSTYEVSTLSSFNMFVL